MTWSFRRRVKIAPGVYINVSKRGVSTSLGPRGAKLTIGKNGTYLNTGIPGTGLYQRRKISGPAGKSNAKDFMKKTDNINLSDTNYEYFVWTIILLVIGICLWITAGLSDDESTRIIYIILGCLSAFIGLILPLANALSENNYGESKDQQINTSSESNKNQPTKSIETNTISSNKSNTPIGMVTKDYFESVKNVTRNVFSFIGSISSNTEIREHILNKVNSNIVLNGKPLSDPSEIIKYLSFADVIRCYKGLGHPIDMHKSEALGLLFYTIYITCEDLPLEYEYLSIILKNMLSSTQNFLTQFENNSTQSNPDVFIIAESLKGLDKEALKKYTILLYRFASVVAKADNVITEREAKWLEKIISLSDNEPEIKASNEISISRKNESEKESSNLKDPYSELETLIGLNSVKKEITSLINYVKIQQLRKSKGMKTSPISYHCVFTGNPGTGKTTVARIVAGIYKNLGILKKGHLIETDRSGLVAEYVGQTAVKTNRIIDSALDGVLFIDEAYSLISDSQNDYGKEAIATLLKRMEDDRDRLVVILAGYSKEMKDFIDSNPGLQSRFNRYIEFPDYSAEELNSIFALNLGKYEYYLTESARIYLLSTLREAVEQKDKNFGNGRFVRNLFEKVIENQANRLSREGIISTDILAKINEEDIKNALPEDLKRESCKPSSYYASTSKEEIFSGPTETLVEPIITTPQWKPWTVKEVEYKEAHLDIITANPDLVTEGVYDARIKDNILNVLSIEAPISKDLLNKKVLSSLGISRIGPRLGKYMDKLYSGLFLQKTGLDPEFIWNEGQNPEDYNEYRPISNRDATNISAEEISNGLYMVLRKRTMLRVDDLLRETAKAFNYSRLGNNVYTAMLTGFRKAQERKIIIVDRENCYLPNDEQNERETI